MRSTRMFLTYLAAGALCLGGVAAILLYVTSSRDQAAAEPPELQPDLVQRVPSDVSVRRRGDRVELGFESRVENHGSGPLLVAGKRSAAEPDMTADQVIERSDGSRVYEGDVGRIRYTRSGGHDHWHYLRFDRYELRRASDHALARPDRKTGFCLGDRYDPGRAFPGKAEKPVLEGDCLKNQPGAREFLQGITIGYGDDYPAYLEGQSIDVTGVPSGLYELVHRANGDRRVRESRYSNNASSVLLRIDWSRGSKGLPRLEQLKSCPRRERCVPA
jgi:Lysyl oxidase